jgi:hypothetical protein
MRPSRHFGVGAVASKAQLPVFPVIPVVTAARRPMIKLEAIGSAAHWPHVAIDPGVATFREKCLMVRKTILGGLAGLSLLAALLAGGVSPARAAGIGQPYDHGRFYYYPYVYYPHNYRAPVQFDNLYYRYPPERQIPVYNKSWHNFYMMGHPYHKGHHFILDVF